MVARIAANLSVRLTLSLIVHLRFDTQCSELFEMRPSLVENRRVIVGHESKALESVRVCRKSLRKNDNGVPVFSYRRAQQYAD